MAIKVATIAKYTLIFITVFIVVDKFILFLSIHFNRSDIENSQHVRTQLDGLTALKSSEDPSIRNVSSVPKVDLSITSISEPQRQHEVNQQKQPSIQSSDIHDIYAKPVIIPKMKTLLRQFYNDVSWDTFTSFPFIENHHSTSASTHFDSSTSSSIHFCSPDIESRLSQPILTQQDIDWCRYALDQSPQGGQVRVGKSWGKFEKGGNSGRMKREKFEELNCNAIAASSSSSSLKSSDGSNSDSNDISAGELRSPSCNDEWGDDHIYNWTKFPSILSYNLLPTLSSTTTSVTASSSSSSSSGNRYTSTNTNKKRNNIQKVCNNPQAKSTVRCYDNESKDRFCVLENVQINFDMMTDKLRGNTPDATKSRIFQKGFISIDCDDTGGSRSSGSEGHSSRNQRKEAEESILKWPHLFDTKIQPHRQCDYVINGTTLIYSHDDIRNVGHTLNDVMNVWLLLWLTHHAHYSQTKNMNLLLIDAFNLGHNFDDDPFSSPFYTPYFNIFKNVLQGSAFHKYLTSNSQSSSKKKSTTTTTTLCLQRVLLQHQPSKPFIWDSWFKDNGCSFIGPSSLFQRWNLAIRSAYGLNGLDNSRVVNGLDNGLGASITSASSAATTTNNAGYSVMKPPSSSLSLTSIKHNNKKVIRIIIISRTATTNRWGNERTSRNILNMDALIQTITQSAVKAFPNHVYSGDSGINNNNNKHKIEVIAVAFEKLKSFEEQVRMAATASIIIGTHGAGLTLGLHMAVGSSGNSGTMTENSGNSDIISAFSHYCCGVVEIFPQGEYLPIKGHGNMFRRMGIRYVRVEVSDADSHNNGATVSTLDTAVAVNRLLSDMVYNSHNNHHNNDHPSVSKPDLTLIQQQLSSSFSLLGQGCLLRSVYEDPYHEKGNNIFSTNE